MSDCPACDAVRVAFSAGLYSDLTHCYSCGRHKHCRGDDPERLICLNCFDLNGHEFPRKEQR